MVPNKKRYREGLIQFSREKRDRWTQKRLESSTSPLWLRVRPRRLPPRTVQDGNVDEFGRQRWQPVITTLRPPKRDDDALALDKSNLAQTLAKRVKPRLPIQRVIWRKETLWRHRLLLCAGGELVRMVGGATPSIIATTMLGPDLRDVVASSTKLFVTHFRAATVDAVSWAGVTPSAEPVKL